MGQQAVQWSDSKGKGVTANAQIGQFKQQADPAALQLPTPCEHPLVAALFGQEVAAIEHGRLL